MCWIHFSHDIAAIFRLFGDAPACVTLSEHWWINQVARDVCQRLSELIMWWYPPGACFPSPLLTSIVLMSVCGPRSMMRRVSCTRIYERFLQYLHNFSSDVCFADVQINSSSSFQNWLNSESPNVYKASNSICESTSVRIVNKSEICLLVNMCLCTNVIIKIIII